MHQEKLISVIVPVYKVEEFLEASVNSIINQTYHNLEIILVDDGSPDNCPQICDQLAKRDKRIKVIHKKNGGVSSARNAGLEVAKGDFVYFCDSDDFIELNTIEKLAQNLEKSDWVMCGYNVIQGGSISEHIYNVNCNTMSEILSHIIHGWDFGLLWNKLYKRKYIDFKFDEMYRVREDLLFNTMYLTKVKTMSIVNEPLYNYIKRQGSLTSNKKEVPFEQLKETHVLMLDYLKTNALDNVIPHQNAVFIKSLINLFKVYSGRKLSKELKTEINAVLDNKTTISALENYEAVGLEEKIFISLIRRRKIRLVMFLTNLKYR